VGGCDLKIEWRSISNLLLMPSSLQVLYLDAALPSSHQVFLCSGADGSSDADEVEESEELCACLQVLSSRSGQSWLDLVTS
jgi:hypothetical protein